jgi:DNA polymerase IIIc chi subunit
MTTIDFYTNVAHPLKLAARIVAKAYRMHGSVRVLTPDADTTNTLDRLLWLDPPLAFLPHCRLASGRFRCLGDWALRPRAWERGRFAQVP